MCWAFSSALATRPCALIASASGWLSSLRIRIPHGEPPRRVVRVVSLVVVGNRWVTTVIGPVRQDRSKSLHSGERFGDLMRGQSRAGLGRGFPDLVHRIFKSGLDGFGQYRIELVDAAQDMSQNHSDGQHICRKCTRFGFAALRQRPQSIMV
jgi:hypothetical protein